MSDFDLKEKFILLRAQGRSFERIATELGKSKQTLVNWSREYEEEIASFKNIELDALREKFFLSKQRKIEPFGKALEKIKIELDERNLEDVPTEKLMDLFLKYYTYLDMENVEPKFSSSEEMAGKKAEKRYLNGLVKVHDDLTTQKLKLG